ncbi:hypothetical protein WR25_22212 [Diploscapter pachys]|uniref:C2H2-type domain-containing protein n=1 Tax=Diploscapter pachys TaxID=2018661 RepID=A0A2A2KRS5_9BILA|nr:hypothetical protein WR25_22212 [Diploscapter pachys]
MAGEETNDIPKAHLSEILGKEPKVLTIDELLLLWGRQASSSLPYPVLFIQKNRTYTPRLLFDAGGSEKRANMVGKTNYLMCLKCLPLLKLFKYGGGQSTRHVLRYHKMPFNRIDTDVENDPEEVNEEDTIGDSCNDSHVHSPAASSSYTPENVTISVTNMTTSIQHPAAHLLICGPPDEIVVLSKAFRSHGINSMESSFKIADFSFVKKSNKLNLKPTQPNRKYLYMKLDSPNDVEFVESFTMNNMKVNLQIHSQLEKLIEWNLEGDSRINLETINNGEIKPDFNGVFSPRTNELKLNEIDTTNMTPSDLLNSWIQQQQQPSVENPNFQIVEPQINGVVNQNPDFFPNEFYSEMASNMSQISGNLDQQPSMEYHQNSPEEMVSPQVLAERILRQKRPSQEYLNSLKSKPKAARPIFECNLCHQKVTSFGTAAECARHVMRRHFGHHRYLCSLCNLGFTHRTNIGKHFQTQHPELANDEKSRYITENWNEIVHGEQLDAWMIQAFGFTRASFRISDYLTQNDQSNQNELDLFEEPNSSGPSSNESDKLKKIQTI